MPTLVEVGVAVFLPLAPKAPKAPKVPNAPNEIGLNGEQCYQESGNEESSHIN